jgi:hypothetical protein
MGCVAARILLSHVQVSRVKEWPLGSENGFNSSSKRLLETTSLSYPYMVHFFLFLFLFSLFTRPVPSTTFYIAALVAEALPISCS